MASEPVSDFTLEQFLLEELPAEERGEIQRRLAEDGGLRARLERLEADRRAFAGSPRARAVLDRLKPRRTARRSAPRFRAWAAALPIGLGIAALVVLAPMAFAPNGPDTRIKGGAVLEPLPRGFPASGLGSGRIAVFGVQDGRPVELPDGTAARRGDRVQVAVNIGKERQALLLSIDGTGHLTLQAPDTLAAALVGDGAPKLLPFAFQLDDAPDFERFVLVTGSAFDAPAVWSQIAAQTKAWLTAHPGQPPVLAVAGLSVTTFDLRKPPKENP